MRNLLFFLAILAVLGACSPQESSKNGVQPPAEADIEAVAEAEAPYELPPDGPLVVLDEEAESKKEELQGFLNYLDSLPPFPDKIDARPLKEPSPVPARAVLRLYKGRQVFLMARTTHKIFLCSRGDGGEIGSCYICGAVSEVCFEFKN